MINLHDSSLSTYSDILKKIIKNVGYIKFMDILCEFMH